MLISIKYISNFALCIMSMLSLMPTVNTDIRLIIYYALYEYIVYWLSGYRKSVANAIDVKQTANRRIIFSGMVGVTMFPDACAVDIHHWYEPCVVFITRKHWFTMFHFVELCNSLILIYMIYQIFTRHIWYMCLKLIMVTNALPPHCAGHHQTQWYLM